MPVKLPSPQEFDTAFSAADQQARDNAEMQGDTLGYTYHRVLTLRETLQQILGSGFEVMSKPGKRGVELIVRPLPRPR